MATLQFLNRINNKLSAEAYTAFEDSCKNYMGKDPLWSQAKLQATSFLNAPGKVQLACIKENHEKPFPSEKEVNLFCVRQICAPLIEAALKSSEGQPFPSFEDKVYPPLNALHIDALKISHTYLCR